MGKFVSAKSELDVFSIFSFYYAVARWRYSFYVISRGKAANQCTLSSDFRFALRETAFSSEAEIMIKEVSFTLAVTEIVFFSDGAASQFKNQYLLQCLTMMIDANDLDNSWNYFASFHGVDGVGGILKRLVWTEIMTGARCSSVLEQSPARIQLSVPEPSTQSFKPARPYPPDPTH